MFSFHVGVGLMCDFALEHSLLHSSFPFQFIVYFLVGCSMHSMTFAIGHEDTLLNCYFLSHPYHYTRFLKIRIDFLNCYIIASLRALVLMPPMKAQIPNNEPSNSHSYTYFQFVGEWFVHILVLTFQAPHHWMKLLPHIPIHTWICWANANPTSSLWPSCMMFLQSPKFNY